MGPKIKECVESEKGPTAPEAVEDGLSEWPEFHIVSAQIDDLAKRALQALEEGRTTEFPR